MASCQFIRCHAYPVSKIVGVLAEASRHPDFCAHVEDPKEPQWPTGSPRLVELAIDEYMSKSAPVLTKNGTLVQRKRRRDHRCLVAGVVTWPDSVVICRSSDYPPDKVKALKLWSQLSKEWLFEQFAENLIAVCSHVDESHPHLHFFIVGDAQRLHPGMRSELVNNKRLEVSVERYIAHKKGLKAWLDDFHLHVGQPCGLLRSLGSRPTWRIKDRGTRSKLLDIDKALADRPCIEIQKQRDEVWDSELKTNFPRLVF